MHGASNPPRRHRAELLTLPSTVLEAIAARLDLKTRAALLPLVCKSFRRLVSGPSASLWHDITFEADISQAPQRARSSAFLSWLRRHGQHSRSLQLDLWNWGVPPPHADAEAAYKQLREALEDTLADTLCSCEFLRLRWGGSTLSVGDWIGGATALTCLALSAHDIRVRGPLASLPCLAHLEVSTVADRGPFFERGCLPPSLTRVCCVPCPVENLVEVQIHGEIVLIGGARSEVPEVMLALPRLAYLDVSESIFDGEHLAEALPRLTHLTSLAFDRCELPDGLPREISLLSRLRVLSFDGCPLYTSEHLPPPPWTVLTCLSRLVSLSLSNSQLVTMPLALTGMTSLQHLYLEYNRLRALPPGPYWAGLRVLAIDWEPLLRSHALLGQAPHLRKLALGCQTVHADDLEGVPPLAPVSALLCALRSHPALREMLLVARTALAPGAGSLVLEAMLSLRGLRPTLEVRPVDHDAFFVEEPLPADEEEAAAQHGQGQQPGQQEEAQQQQPGPQQDGGVGVGGAAGEEAAAAAAGGAGAAAPP